jgi:hypothetical protein
MACQFNGSTSTPRSATLDLRPDGFNGSIRLFSKPGLAKRHFIAFMSVFFVNLPYRRGLDQSIVSFAVVPPDLDRLCTGFAINLSPQSISARGRSVLNVQCNPAFMSGTFWPFSCSRKAANELRRLQDDKTEPGFSDPARDGRIEQVSRAGRLETRTMTSASQSSGVIDDPFSTSPPRTYSILVYRRSSRFQPATPQGAATIFDDFALSAATMNGWYLFALTNPALQIATGRHSTKHPA